MAGSKLMDAVKADDVEVSWLVKHQADIEDRFTNPVPAARFIASLKNLIESTPDLAHCSGESVLGSVFLAADLGLDLNPLMGEFHIRPEWVDRPSGERRLIAIPIIGYPGYARLAYNTGRVEKMETWFVREGDEWDYFGDSDKGRQFLWRPKDDDETRPWERVVALVKIINAGTVWVSLTRAQVNARNMGTTFWQDHFDAMARKTAIRELAPLMPKSVELGRALQSDEQHVEKVEGVDEVVTR